MYINILYHYIYINIIYININIIYIYKYNIYIYKYYIHICRVYIRKTKNYFWSAPRFPRPGGQTLHAGAGHIEPIVSGRRVPVGSVGSFPQRGEIVPPRRKRGRIPLCCGDYGRLWHIYILDIDGVSWEIMGYLWDIMGGYGILMGYLWEIYGRLWIIAGYS